MKRSARMRRNTISGIYTEINDELDKSGLSNVTLDFNEWWNGEGIDINITQGESTEKISLSLIEAHAVAVVLAAAGIIDPTDVIADADLLSSKENLNVST